ncbi:hypothetical protein [Paraburkholderia fungorum]|nr:hypothetical protein [Paraburkholderia fungorum]
MARKLHVDPYPAGSLTRVDQLLDCGNYRETSSGDRTQIRNRVYG